MARGESAGRQLSQVIDRRTTARGELVLRQAGTHFELISNGVFLMDTRSGESERLLARLALDSRDRPARVLIAGLGVGFTLHEARCHPLTTDITVVEVEQAVIDWQRTHLARFSEHALDDPRVRVARRDLLDWLGAEQGSFDVVCIDIDNSPQWTVADRNADLYTEAGLLRVAAAVDVGGTVAFWSAAEDRAFAERLETVFGNVRRHAVPVRRGVPDVIYLAGG